MKKTPSTPAPPSLTNEQARFEEIVKTKEALRASEERFAKIFHLIPFRMGILRIRDGVVLEVNDTWIKETGFSRADIINQSIFKLSPTMEDEMVETFARY